RARPRGREEACAIHRVRRTAHRPAGGHARVRGIRDERPRALNPRLVPTFVRYPKRLVVHALGEPQGSRQATIRLRKLRGCSPGSAARVALGIRIEMPPPHTHAVPNEAMATSSVTQGGTSPGSDRARFEWMRRPPAPETSRSNEMEAFSAVVT